MEGMKIIESSELPIGEKVYLKKDWLGWRVVQPWKDPETGKINWFNFLVGGKKGLFFLITVLVITLLLYVGINELIKNYKFIVDNLCTYCSECGKTRFLYKPGVLNLTI